MDRTDIEFTVGLNTSPAEKQLDLLYDKMRYPGVANHAEPLLQQVSKEYQQGFKMVGGVYDTGSNHFAVPSVKVFETALVTTSQTIQKFNTVVGNVIHLSNTVIDSYARRISRPQIEYKPNTFSPYKNIPHISSVYQQFMNERERGFTFEDYEGNNYDVPSTIINSGGLMRTAPRVSNWSPNEFYTRDQVRDINNSINNPEAVFDAIIKKRNAKPDNPYVGIYGTFRSLHNANSMYEYFKSIFGNNYEDTRKQMALPAPKNIWNGADGNDTPEEQGKDIVDQDKKDNDELKAKVLLWGKILSYVYAIRKVLQGLAKVWQFGTETVSGVNSNINEEHGFFSVDPEGALRANSDKTRAMFYAGIRNMGENAPVSKEGFDYASSKMTELWTSAMAGRNVDARTTIDVQRLKDFFGIDLTVAGLLTGEREGKTATDIQLDMMDKVEKQIQKLAEADEVTKGQVIDSLKNILGDELVNAIVANANKNLKIDATELKLTLAEKVMEHGGSAIPSGDLTQATEGAVKSISNLNDEVQKLKNTLVQELSPAFVKVTDAIIGLVKWLNRKINKVDGTKNATGEILFKTSVASLTNDYNAYGQFAQKEDDTADEFKDKEKRIARDLKSKNAYEIFEAMWLSQPEAINASSIENLGIKATQSLIGNKLIKGELDEKSENPVERAMAKHTWVDAKGVTHKGIEAYKLQLANDGNIKWNNDLVYQLFNNPQNMSPYDQIRAYEYFIKNNPEVQGYFADAFDKGGDLDYNTNMNAGRYLMQHAFYESPEQFAEFLNEMKNQMKEVADNTVEFSTQWTDKNHNGKKDFGEMTVTIVVKDQYGKEIRKEPLTAQLN